MKNNVLRKTRILITAAVMITALSIFVFNFSQNAEAKTITNGYVYLENINVTDMTQEEIQEVIDQKLEKYSQSQITLYVLGTPVTVTAGELGLYNADEGLAARAANTEVRGNILQKYNLKKQVENAGAVFYQLNLHVSEDAVREVIEEKCCIYDKDPQNMKVYKQEDGTFLTEPKTDGQYVQVDSSVNIVCDYLNSDWHGGTGAVYLDVTYVEGLGTAEDMDQVKDLLGTGTTYYDTDGYDERCANIARAAQIINGTVLFPGEEFSVVSKISPFTADNGYYLAPQYLDGRSVDSYGGGVCQVSTTLYRAVLESELEVTERCQHSMVVGYVDPSMDAAVAEGGSKDLKFVNNTDYPIYIEASVATGSITFNIYGHETRDPSRTLAFYGEAYNIDEEETYYVLDSTLEFGEITFSYGHTGEDASAYKVVYINGVEQSTERINSSTYEKSDNIYYVGIANAPSGAISELQEACDDKDQGMIYTILAEYGAG